ncbi:VOC family protein [Luteolibacter pohnpeiensis]|uniref:VOC family protein n=1 Tax=Luteolibacter pohnpeiensis TaxID=454153 RepID=A0A934S570_9BACT|nr:VOC family protein [Luteolibacter pohnpeiensis]MBK1882776.1 VOC family protein [Luteolibacter pohnpeiensis]
MAISAKITPCLWFDSEAEQAAEFYVSIFKNSRIVRRTYYSDVGKEIHGREAGSVMTIEFELEGQTFTALNGGPLFTLTEAISFMVDCADQAEVDYFWDQLSDGGPEESQQCGWLKDRFGVTWQIVPSILPELVTGPDREKSDRAMSAMLEMKKLNIAALQAAYEGIDPMEP